MKNKIIQVMLDFCLTVWFHTQGLVKQVRLMDKQQHKAAND